MQDLWTRLESWLAVHAPNKLETLAPGATDEQIAHAETLMSVRLPEDFKASCRIHNGQRGKDEVLMNIRELLSLERIEEEWKESFDPGDGDWSDEPWWNKKWIPFTYNGAGDYDCLDLVPSHSGHVGQVIDFWHDDARREVKAHSFGDWFLAFVEGCENGSYIYSDEYGISDMIGQDGAFSSDSPN